MISVIIPVYNECRERLEKCFGSLWKQTYKDFEVLIVDDGSRMECNDLLNEFAKKDQRFKVMRQENSGVSSARNRGLENAKGEYITFIDCDDWIEKDFFKHSLEIIEKYNADIVIGGLKIQKKNSVTENCICSKENLLFSGTERKILQKYVLTTHYETDHPELKGLKCSGPWNKLIRRKCIGDVRFKTDLPVYEDVIFNVEVMDKADRIVVSPESWYTYAIYSNSAMRRYRANGIEEQKAVLNYLLKLKHRCPEFSKAIAVKTAGCLKKIDFCTISHPESIIKNRSDVWKKILNDDMVRELIKDYDKKEYPEIRINEYVFALLCKYRMCELITLAGMIKK